MSSCSLITLAVMFDVQLFSAGALPTIVDVPLPLRKPSKSRKPPTIRPSLASHVPQSGQDKQLKPHQTSNTDPSTLITEHSYDLSSQRKLKKRLDTVSSALESSRKRLRASQQRNRRLTKRLQSACDIISDLQRKNLLSRQAAENMSASFSGAE